MQTYVKIIAAAAITCGCLGVYLLNHNKYHGHYIYKEPAKVMVTGEWEIDPRSMPSVLKRTEAASAHPQLTILGSDWFMARDMPVEDAFSLTRWRLKTGQGHWAMNDNQSVVLDFAFQDGFVFQMDIKESKRGALDLTHSVGDPDSDEVWIWRRIEHQ